MICGKDLAQLCVGITHAERGNRTGALRLIGRAREQLGDLTADRPTNLRAATCGGHRLDPTPGTRGGRMQAPGWMISPSEAGSAIPSELHSSRSRAPTHGESRHQAGELRPMPPAFVTRE